MALRIALVAPALLSALCLPAVALAAPAEEGVAPGAEDAAIEVASAPEAEAEAPAVEAPAAEAEAPAEPAPSEAPVVSDEVAEPEGLSEAERAEIQAMLEAEQYDHYVEDYDYDDYDDDYESKRTVLELDSGYFGLGIAPGMTLHDSGFHPNTRFEFEFGGTLEHRYRDLGLSFGVVTHVTPYYGRKKPSFGADVTSTAMLGPIYIRTGLGALGRLPRNHQVGYTSPAIGGVVGAGFNFGRAPMVRVGVDYDFRVTTRLEPIHTVFLAVRIACCREE